MGHKAAGHTAHSVWKQREERERGFLVLSSLSSRSSVQDSSLWNAAAASHLHLSWNSFLELEVCFHGDSKFSKLPIKTNCHNSLIKVRDAPERRQSSEDGVTYVISKPGKVLPLWRVTISAKKKWF